MVFYGEYEVSITSGGRIALPKKVRDVSRGNTIVITKGFNQSLAGYSQQDWEQRAEDLLNVSLLDGENLEKRRRLFSSTVYVELDEQGRGVLPKSLREYAHLKKKTVVIGVGDHFEIWDYDRWQEYQEEISQV